MSELSTKQHKRDSNKLFSRLRFRWGDAVVILCVLVAAVCLGGMYIYKAHQTEDSLRVLITQDGAVLMNRSLSSFETPENLTITTEHGTLTVYLSSSEVYISSSDCDDQICVHQGSLSQAGDGAVCLPNRVVVEIISDDEATEKSVDMVAR